MTAIIIAVAILVSWAWAATVTNGTSIGQEVAIPVHLQDGQGAFGSRE